MFQSLSFNYLVLIIALIIPNISFGQHLTIQGNVKKQSDNSPVEYASIGIKGKPFGTIADSMGHFTLIIDQSAIDGTDTIVFSSIGYSSQRILVKDALNKDLGVLLTASPVTQLDEVVVNETKSKLKTYGRTAARMVLNPKAYSSYPTISDISGREQATILKIDDDIMLKELNFLLIRNNFKELMFRLNIYSVKNNLPDTLILSKEVLFETTVDKGWKKIDLLEYGIRIKDHKEIAVALQLVTSTLAPGDSLKYSYLIPSYPSPLRKSYFREKSESEWNEVGTSYLYLNIDAFRLKGRD